jgi:hypothetical protein
MFSLLLPTISNKTVLEIKKNKKQAEFKRTFDSLLAVKWTTIYCSVNHKCKVWWGGR